MDRSKFIHLHTHSEYSILDGLARISGLIEKCKKLSMHAIALTDHGNMFGAIEFYTESMKKGIKPIIGCEFYVATKSRKEPKKDGENETTHLIALAKNEIGYRNLIKLSSAGYTEGFHYKPRVDKEILKKHNEGLIILSGCLQGEIQKLILKNDYVSAFKLATEYREIYGDNFYLEIMDNGISEQKKILPAMNKLSHDLNIPMVVTNDIHFLNKDDVEAHDILLCIQTKRKIAETNRLKFGSDQFYLKSEQEMRETLKNYQEAIDQTFDIANSCNLTLEFNKYKLPKYQIPPDMTYDKYLDELCYKGLEEKYSNVTPEIEERLKSELKMIEKMGFSSYFLIVADFVNFAKKNGIFVGPGRGSAVGSVVSYVLGITNIEPTRYALLFERFLNPARATMPDIDIDFDPNRRDEVYEYIRQTYGKDKVSQIITFGTMKAKAVVRDVARVLDIPLNEADRIAKLIPYDPKIKLKDAIQLVPELKQEFNKTEIHKKLLTNSIKLEGLIRHPSVHAAGVVISDKVITDYVALYIDKSSDTLVTQASMDTLKKVGLLKIDLLGLKTLSIIKTALEYIKHYKNIGIDLDKLSFDDSKTYKLLQKGNTMGIFQIESPGMRNTLKKFKPTKFEDIIAIIALYRPGPMKMIDDIIKRKDGKVKYEIENKLKHVLEETYGYMIYQEQVMQISQIVAGYSLAEADLLRRAMSEKDSSLIKEQENIFLNKSKEKGFPANKAKKIFEMIAEFASYGFNKSHATAYAVLVYYTGYLKANYMTEFLTAILSNNYDNTDDIVKYTQECFARKIEVLPPDINKSKALFSIERENSIRFALAALKNVGYKAACYIEEHVKKDGPFKSYSNFTGRIDLKNVNKRVIEALIKSGSMDIFNIPRKIMLENIDKAMNIGQQIRLEKERGQIGLFGTSINELDLDDDPKKEWLDAEKLYHEKEILGFYLTGNPLEKYKKEIKKFTNANIENLKDHANMQQISFAGLITEIKVSRTKIGNKEIAYIKTEDMNNSVECTVLPEVYEKIKHKIKKDIPVIIKGKLRIDDHENVKILISDIQTMDKLSKKLIDKINIRLDPGSIDVTKFEIIRDILLEHRGECPVFLHINSNGSETIAKTSAALQADPSEKLKNQIIKIVGKDSIWYTTQ